MDPLVSLLIGTLVLLVVVGVFYPDYGLYYIIKRFNKDNAKENIEDALKHLYDCEYKGVDCSIDSLAGNLHLRQNDVMDLAAKMGKMGLIIISANKLNLTQEGRVYALRMIRIHRLWEKYLADFTSVKETEWHQIAEEKEHQISNEEANKLAAQLGNPLLDPHGDPIPTELGEIPKHEGVTLNLIEEGLFVRIKHIEDEPKEVFAQLTAQGLFPGMQLYVLENNSNKIKFEAEGEVCILAPILASNILVEKIIEKENIQQNFETLTSLKEDECAEIIGISRAVRGQQRRRLLDFGIVPGSKVRAVLKSLSGDPTGYEVRGAIIALRKEQSNLIYIKKK
ncbi:MAG: FeoA domain-containing protein [Melioribacteraceae bacterium]|nr:FeoA domain-containing protein [Melioribacteraceae bacterium]